MGEMMQSLYLADEQASMTLGRYLAYSLQAPLVLCFDGQLGMGKTTIIRSLLRELGVSGAIKSPTFSIVEQYLTSGFTVNHFDCYRVHHCDEFESLENYMPITESFAEMLEQSLASVDMRKGAIVEATVVEVRPDRITVNAGLKSDGIIPAVEFGGEEVCMPLIEDDIDAILERSVFLYGDDAEMCPGAPSQCHGNSADLWSQSVHTHMGLMTGYALSKDGMGRQHSWCVYLETGQVIETTESRLAYYGFVMTEEEALSFTSDNY